MEIVSRLIDRNSDYRQLIPATAETEIVIKKSDFKVELRKSALFARESGRNYNYRIRGKIRCFLFISIAFEYENTQRQRPKYPADGQVTLTPRYPTEVLNIADADEIIFVSYRGNCRRVIREQVKIRLYAHYYAA